MNIAYHFLKNVVVFLAYCHDNSSISYYSKLMIDKGLNNAGTTSVSHVYHMSFYDLRNFTGIGLQGNDMDG